MAKTIIGERIHFRPAAIPASIAFYAWDRTDIHIIVKVRQRNQVIEIPQPSKVGSMLAWDLITTPAHSTVVIHVVKRKDVCLITTALCIDKSVTQLGMLFRRAPEGNVIQMPWTICLFGQGMGDDDIYKFIKKELLFAVWFMMQKQMNL